MTSARSATQHVTLRRPPRVLRMASAPQAHLCRAVGAAPLPLAQRRAAIAHILAQPGSAADPPVLAALAVEWVQSGNDVLAADLLNHIAAKSHALPSIASLLDRKPPLAVPHLLTVFLHLFSAREKANTGSSLADQCTVSEGLGPILNDAKLAPEAQAALARLLLHHPACRPTGIDFITRATIWLTLVQLDTHFNDYANAFVSLIVSEWGDRMEKVMVALNRLFAIVASEDATPSPALAFLLSAVPPGFISFASEHVTAARDISDAQILLAMQRISSWPLTERIAAWLLALIRGLRTAGRREVLASFATQNAAAVCVQLGSRTLVTTALPVVESVLLGYQETAVPFLSTLPRLLPMLVNVSLDAKSEKCLEVNYAVCEEIRQLHNGERAPALLTEAEAKQLSEILWAGIFRHPGHPEVYAPLVRALDRFARPADDQLKARLVAADWLLSGSASGGAAGDVEVRGRGADGVGLVNCGNTCYAAVIMQSLFHTEPFRAAVFALQPPPARKTVAHELQRLFAFLALTHRAAHVPQHLLDVLPAQFRAGTQQDASELSKFMLDRLDTELKPSPGRATVSDAFGGCIANVVRCSDCRGESVREEDMLDLTLSLPENGDTAPLEKLLESAWAPEQLTGEARYRCDACGGLRDAERRTLLVKAPHHLIVTLNRFAYDPKTGRRTKLLSDVPYPETLLVPVAGAPVGYTLYAVVLHSGLSPEHGHYYAYARPSASGTAQTWRRFNDSDVAPSTFADFSAITRAFRSDVPYLLFYRRLDEPPVDAAAPPAAATAAPLRFDVPGPLQEQVAADNRRFVEEQQRDQRRRHLQRAAHVSQRYHYDDPGAGGPPPFCKDNFGPGNSGAGGGWNRDVF